MDPCYSAQHSSDMCPFYTLSKRFRIVAPVLHSQEVTLWYAHIPTGVFTNQLF